MKYQNSRIVGQRKALVDKLVGGHFFHEWQVDNIIKALMDRLPERLYELIECGQSYDRVWASTINDALETAINQFDESVYVAESTSWIEVAVEDVADRERLSTTMTVEPREPGCVSGYDHDWCSPYSLLGGLKENPGVWGHGGGVIITSVCSQCGTYRRKDTWAQNPATGEQGLESVSFEEPDADSLAWVESREEEE